MTSHPVRVRACWSRCRRTVVRCSGRTGGGFPGVRGARPGSRVLPTCRPSSRHSRRPSSTPHLQRPAIHSYTWHQIHDIMTVTSTPESLHIEPHLSVTVIVTALTVLGWLTARSLPHLSGDQYRLFQTCSQNVLHPAHSGFFDDNALY